MGLNTSMSTVSSRASARWGTSGGITTIWPDRRVTSSSGTPIHRRSAPSRIQVTCSLTWEWVGTIAPRRSTTRAIISFRPVTSWREMTLFTGVVKVGDLPVEERTVPPSHQLDPADRRRDHRQVGAPLAVPLRDLARVGRPDLRRQVLLAEAVDMVARNLPRDERRGAA